MIAPILQLGIANSIQLRPTAFFVSGPRRLKKDRNAISQNIGAKECPMNIESILAVKGREVRTIRPEATVAEAVRRMRAETVGSLVVSDDDVRIHGIVSDRGIMNAIADRGVAAMNERIGNMMTKEVFTCSPEDRVSAIMGLMTQRRIRHIPVVDSQGQLCGIISIGDVVKHRLDEIQREADALREYISGTA
jgi:CBS domain-containing protein